jgi:ribosomal protein S18 acetylase RimI-like enzyme
MSPVDALRCEDWRGADGAALARLYRAECRRWRETLAWDFAPSCDIIEAARRAGRLPGLLVRRRGGAIAGWSFFVVHDGLLQVGALVGESDSSRRALLRAAVVSSEAAAVRGVSCYLYPQSSSLRRVLEQERFEVQAHHYLSCDLPMARATQVVSWPTELVPGPLVDGDADLIVHLVARAYAGTREGTCFAPDLRTDQWAHYVGQLVQSEGCGRYMPAASLAVRDATDGQPVAAILMTHISEGTAHLAQVVVDRRWRGRALARNLVFESCRTLAAAGYRRVTLLVADGNQAARHLYRQLGFDDLQVFLHGVRPGTT